MMRAASRLIFCLDHTKFGRKSISPLTPLAPNLTIVTDLQAPEALVKDLRARGLEVVLAATAEGVSQ